MKKSLTFLLGTLMVAGVLAGATTSVKTTKSGTTTIGSTPHGSPGMPICPQCNGGGSN